MTRVPRRSKGDRVSNSGKQRSTVRRVNRTLLLVAFTLLACRTNQAEPVAPRTPSSAAASAVARPELPWAYAAHGEAIPVGGPVIALEGRAIRVDDAVVGSIDGKSTLGLLPALDDLATVLRGKRDAWKSAHGPSDPFPGFVVTRVPAKTELLVIRLLVNSALLAGYPHAFHVVRTGDGSHEAAVQLDPAVPTAGKAPARLLLRLVAKEISLIWHDPNAGDLWNGSLPRELLRPSTPSTNAPPPLIDGLRSAWAKAPPDAHEWMVSASNACEPFDVIVALVDAIAMVRGDTATTVSLGGGSSLGQCE